jgi:hypothetical protein
MALYSDVGGMPSLLEAQSEEGVVGDGINVFAVSPSQAVQPGNYWIMAEYTATTILCVDSSSSNTLVYASEAFGTFPANFSVAPMAAATNTVDYNFFAVSSD